MRKIFLAVFIVCIPGGKVCAQTQTTSAAPHWFSEITSDQIVYLVVRVDPHKALPAGYMPK